MSHSIAKRLILAALKIAGDAQKTLNSGGSITEKIHDIRVSLKKIRSILWIFAHDDESLAFKKLLVDLNAIANSLSIRRDQDVMEELLGNYMIKKIPLHSFATTRSATLKSLTRNMVRADRLIQDSANRIQLRVGKGKIGRIVDERTSRLFRRVKKRFEKIRQTPSPELFHSWRKSVKRLYYLVDFHLVKTVSGNSTRKTLNELGKKLGDLHDLYNLESHLASGKMNSFLEKTSRTGILKMVRRDADKLARQAIRMGGEISSNKF